MDPKNIAGITVYNDLLTVLEEKGLSNTEATEIFMKLTAQAEMEVTEEVLKKLTDEQLKILEELPDDASANDIAEKLNLDGNEIDVIRAEKVATLIEEIVPSLNE